MEIIIRETAKSATAIAARIIANLLLLYRTLIDTNLDWSNATTFNLDEYIGLPREHPQTPMRL